ncbi:arabinogalactan endo-1,4-beta-galactosidase [Streptomyces avermitilis]|uniref:Arabinogalactan endo-beta-1,4-galactanase n=3 Tax=Streptomyces TaxID=1883 RepID=Q82NH9_STRAW|nr:MULTISPECIES: arabinogalactan endo-1,4-beta-galactosidase [Streptomyces]KUN55243.1 arabinogalactan endo-1,4-beta-galactosidase [Streptomyces avermitilis]MYS96953.1 arabinogalactan endo-1,4-beta-galactosidase [Streptomyces sp. SID5469]OOV26655.1 arabinogalactan endo-1,4-beta-galactosidase [Streptomyces avermitilis]BAC69034.1 putative arabinogalactan endo-1,4-beta-galactosidase, secreted [Streptomyces avermitilis MA-4680 = NBRC 14893]BBJ48973.1 arabinogalactan endo-beta-1,4-galactanase [Strep
MFHARRALRALLIPLFAGLALTTLPATSARAAATLTNPGFESDGTGTATPAGWSTYSAAGQNAASFTESGGRSGSYRLTHWSASAYKVETYQYLSGLANGNYTLTAWVRSGGGQNSAYLALKNCGGTEQRTDLPVSAGGWIRIVTPVAVTGNQCTISVNSDANAGNWLNVDDLTFTSGTTGLGIKGSDISSLAKSEAFGGVYKTGSGTTGDALTILKSAGMNYARLKVWVNPADGYNNKTRVLAMAKRVKAQGMKLLVDFHYSDTWADPGAQSKPAAWAGHSYSQLKTDVYNHTYDVLSALKSQGTTADMVQIGNEINGGMLWSEGSTDNWPQLAGLLNSGYSATKAVSSSTVVALHLAKGGDLAGTRAWFDKAVAGGVNFDAIGLSYYGYWHGSLYDFQTTLDDAASRYGKPVFLAETAYPFRLDSDDSLTNQIDTTGELVSGYAATTAGQSAWLRDVMNIVEAVPNGRGLGVFYWEATWTAVTGNGWDPADAASGNGWENQALFGYDDKALPAMTLFSHR